LITATGLTWKISFRYILISPPLTYAWFFMPFKRDAYDHALVNAMVMEVRRRRQMDYESWNCPILVLYGNGDQYLTDLTEWARLLRDRVEYAPEGDTRDADIALLRNVEFNCDHFWNSALARTRLVEVVQSWL
jgi:pimeloyl-ACP methyl ester carboxylesterase